MCTNYVAPGEEAGLSELKINNFRDLYRWTPWRQEIYQDYAAPIVASVEAVPAVEMTAEPAVAAAK
ncbi:hypothetical protein [Burkholderia multivorans]|uniref:hypothetical protein n=1 Tax=Burkholderia multivorans TaxID=87883 RepID=UPI003BFA7582